MPRGSNKVGRYKKHGTNNVDQAAARDEAAATAAAAVQRAAAEALLAMESPAAVVHPSPATAVQPRPNTVAQEERRRQAIVWKYEQLGSPPQELWRGPGGTLSIIRVWLELPYTADVRPIERVLERHVEGQPLKLAGQGRKAKLTPSACVFVRVWALWVASGVAVRVLGLCELKNIHTANYLGTIRSS